MDSVDEQIDATTRVVLGVSVACARCHDHKFEAIPQSDYYALAGIFQSTETYYGTVQGLQNRNPSGLIELPIDDLSGFEKKLDRSALAKLRESMDEKQAKMQSMQQARFASMRRGSDTKTADVKIDPQQAIRQLIRLNAEIADIQAKIDTYTATGQPLSFCMGTQPAEENRNARLLVGGEVDTPAQEVPRGFVQVLGESISIPEDSSGRLELARWLTSRENPLAARVMVNRIWQHLLGEGIVRTPDDFGITGIKPTHQELLDYLAVQFVESGWSVKSMVREIATSRVYRLASSHDETKFNADPENKLLWRANKKRLEGEVIRDAMLVAAGQLDLERPRASLVAKGRTDAVRRAGRCFSYGSKDRRKTCQGNAEQSNARWSGQRPQLRRD